MDPSGADLGSTADPNITRQEIKIDILSTSDHRFEPPPPPPPKLPCADLLKRTRENYVKVGVPLYEASISGDWKAASAILVKLPELVRFAITDNYEIALHVAASMEDTKLTEDFVQNLVSAYVNFTSCCSVGRRHQIDGRRRHKAKALTLKALDVLNARCSLGVVALAPRLVQECLMLLRP